MTFTIDLTKVRSYYEFHEHLKNVFSLPDHYGRNMDALWDCLHCAFTEPTTIEVIGITKIPKDLQALASRLQLVLQYLADEDGVTISYS